MELSERFIQTLEKEGFTHVYEWQDVPGVVYPERSNEGKMAVYVTDGTITYNISGQKKVLYPGQRLDIPAGQVYSAIVGEAGAIYIVGEMANKGS